MYKKLVLAVIFVSTLNLSHAQESINDYKYVVVPHHFDFVKGEDTYRLNTMTRYMLKQNGFNAYMVKEIKENDYKNNNCLALTANVLNVSSFLKTKLKVVLTNCDDKVIYETEEGISKLKEYEKAYKDALTKAFQSFEDVSYNYTPNDEILSRASKTEKEDSEEVSKLKEEIKALKETKSVNEEKAPKLEEKVDVKPVVKEAKKEMVFYIAEASDNGYKLVNNTTKQVEFELNKTSMKDVYTLKGRNGIVYKSDGKWIMEYTVNEAQVSKPIDIRF